MQGLRLNALRDGPLDKHGAGSGILNAKGQVVKAELARLDSFAADKADPAGGQERGHGGQLPEAAAGEKRPTRIGNHGQATCGIGFKSAEGRQTAGMGRTFNRACAP